MKLNKSKGSGLGCLVQIAWTRSASCRQSHPPLASTFLSFPTRERGRAMTAVSARVTVILSCRSVPTGLRVNTFLPVLGPHQSAPCALRIYIPAHQELPPFGLQGLWLHQAMVGEKPV